jgi:hypothetical protein
MSPYGTTRTFRNVCCSTRPKKKKEAPSETPEYLWAKAGRVSARLKSKRERKPTGEYRYDGNVANRALELLGKQQGMFIDRHEVGQPNEFADWTDEELEAFIKSGTKRLGIVSGKTQH